MRRDDTGLTLIELMITCLILSLVLLAITGVTISILTTQRTVAAVTTTTSTAQAAADQIAAGIRNASDVRLTTPTGSDQLLVVRTADRGSTLSWSCRAWYYSATEGSIRSTRTSGASIAAPTSTQLATWTVVIEDVVPRSGSTIFTVVSGGISLAFDARIDASTPVVIETTAVKRTGVTEVGSCF